MKEKEFRMFFTEYPDTADLPEEERMLVEASMDAAGKAYAPYSHFNVGAAILLNDGTVVKGANVENAAFPSGNCAERSALSYAVSNYPDLHPVAIAITAFTEGDISAQPVPPCGNCRQMLLEHEVRQEKPIKVILAGGKKILVIKDCASLMPLHFTRDNLNPRL